MSDICWSNSSESHKHNWRTWNELLDTAERLSGRGPLLDVGCGTGQFLAFARSRGWTQLTGLEVISEIAEVAKQFSQATVHTTDIFHATLTPGSFSAVMIWDLLEHVGDVGAVLREAFRLLKPGGVILIGTVHFQGLSMRVFREWAFTVNPPEHLTFFTKKGLSAALGKAGFEVKKVWSYILYLKEWSRMASPEYKRLRLGLTSSAVFLTVMEVGNVLLKWTHLGDELVAVAQKSAS